MTVFFITVFTIYFLFLFLLIVGWNRFLNAKQSGTTNHIHFISVIVPFRNEMSNLPVLIETLKKLDYPKEKFEILLIDDHSTDQSLTVASELTSDVTNFRIVSAHSIGKKQAITQGVEISKGEIIVTTDADCDLPANWLKSINHFFDDKSVKMVLGAVRIKTNDTFFSKLQATEFHSLMGSTVATLSLGFPTMCNGANLSYRKEAFMEAMGFEGNHHIASGDDEFLMRKVLMNFGVKSLRFLNDVDAVVATTPQASLKEFFNQRVRWAGKWRHNTSFVPFFLALFILLFQISWLVAMGTLFFHSWNNTIAILLVVKMLIEGFFLFKISVFMKQKFSIRAFLTLQVIYPIYVVMVGVLSNVIGISWKERPVLSQG